MTSTHPDGGTRLSRGGETVYRGLGVAAFAEQVVIQENGAVRIARDVRLDVACVIGCAVQTGVGAALLHRRAAASATPRWCSGLGGIGLSIVQGAKPGRRDHDHRLGPGRRAAARPPSRFGATHVVDPTTEDLVGAVRWTSPADRASTWPSTPWAARALVADRAGRHPHGRHHRHGRASRPSTSSS